MKPRINLNDINLLNVINELKTDKYIELEVGIDHVDIIALKEYGDYNYWIYVAMYNNIQIPFNLIEQGFTKIRLFLKSDLETRLIKYYQDKK